MKLLVIDDHPVVLDGLVALLGGSDMSPTMLQAADMAGGQALIAAHPDIALVMLDLTMPGLSGMAAIDAIRQARPALAIVIISALETPDDVRRAMARGARGYIPKSSRPETLLAAVRLVLAGETYLPSVLLVHDEPSPRPIISGRLTPRQVEILRALSAGQSNKEIASRFGLSDKTVKTHVGAIFRELNVVNRTQAAAIWMHASGGLEEPQERLLS